jgi:hypothetical protein
MSNPERTPIIGGSDTVKLRGDRVVINDLEIVSSDLVEYLASQEDAEFAFRELIDVAVKVKSLASSTVASQEIKNKVETLVSELQKSYEKIVLKLENEAKNLTDPEKGSVSTAIKDMADKTLKNLLTPDDNPADPSPINRFKNQLLDELEGFSENITNSLTAIQTKLGVGVEKKKVASDGNDFENNVAVVVQYYGRIYGDTVEATGAKSEVGAAKKGDVLVTLNTDDTLGQKCAIVWEAKTDSTFKLQSKTKSSRVSLDKVRKEMDEALSNRNAQVGVFVIDSDGLDMDVQAAWQELDGNKLILVLDPNEISEEMVQLAYLWARWKAKASVANFEVKVDTEGIKRTIETLRVQIKDLKNVTLHQNAAIKSVNDASTVLENFKSNAKNALADLAGMINVELDPANND